MIKFARKALFLSILGAAASLHAATVELTAGSGQQVTLYDPAGSGKSAVVSLPGGGATHLEFSNGTGVLGGVPTTSIGGFIGLHNVIKAKFSAREGALINEKFVKISRETLRYAANVDANIHKIVLDVSTGSVSQIDPTGIFQADAISLTHNGGGTFVVQNIRIDPLNRKIYGDVVVSPLLWNDSTQTEYQQPYSIANVHLWNFDPPVGKTSIPVPLFSTASISTLQNAGYEVLPNPRGGCQVVWKVILPKLKITADGFSAYSKALGYHYQGAWYNTLQQLNTREPDGWGSMVLTHKLDLHPAGGACAK